MMAGQVTVVIPAIYNKASADPHLSNCYLIDNQKSNQVDLAASRWPFHGGLMTPQLKQQTPEKYCAVEHAGSALVHFKGTKKVLIGTFVYTAICAIFLIWCLFAYNKQPDIAIKLGLAAIFGTGFGIKESIKALREYREKAQDLADFSPHQIEQAKHLLKNAQPTQLSAEEAAIVSAMVDEWVGPPWQQWLWSFGCIAAGLLFLGVSVHAIIDEVKLYNSGANTVAIVTKAEKQFSGSLEVAYEFKHGGKTFESSHFAYPHLEYTKTSYELNSAEYSKAVKSKQIEVRYLPSNPLINRPASGPDLVIIFLGPIIGLICLGGSILFLPKRRAFASAKSANN